MIMTHHVVFQAVSSVNTLLEKADRLYKQLQLNRPALESLLIKVNEYGHDRSSQDDISVTSAQLPTSMAASAAPGNKGIVDESCFIYF